LSALYRANTSEPNDCLIRYRPPLGVICWLTGARPDEVGRVDLQRAAGTEYLLSLWAADEFIQPGTVSSKGQSTGRLQQHPRNATVNTVNGTAARPRPC